MSTVDIFGFLFGIRWMSVGVRGFLNPLLVILLPHLLPTVGEGRRGVEAGRNGAAGQIP